MSGMRDEHFWAIISAATSGRDPQTGLEAELGARPLDDVIEFDAHLHGLMRRCWSEELWHLAGRVLDHLDDASFEWFRLWLVFQGRSTFEAVLARCDRLADLPADATGHQLDGPQYVAWQVYRRRTGAPMPARRQPPAHLRLLGTSRP